MKKINIAELLKDCPTGMELDCTIYDNLYFDCIREHKIYPIVCYTVDSKGEKHETSFNWYGKHTPIDTAKCVIFPKGKTTWEGFQRPFKDGDILTNYRGSIYIYKGPMNYNKNLADFYCGYRRADHAFVLKYVKGTHFGDINECHLASEEDKTKLFQIMKRNGYKWNSETKILEKLIAPKFKVGNRIKYKNGIEQGVILSITDNTYDVAVTNNIGISVRIIDQDEWELIPNKFDINTLIPFESKVLVRHNKDNKWTGSFFSFIDRDLHSHCYKFVTTADKSYPMMIPYKGNEHLLGKVEDCKDFYKIWE